MKQILWINGSPKGRHSISREFGKQFVKGFASEEKCHVEEIILKELTIKECEGAFDCWKNVNGRCPIDDDMKGLVEKYVRADIVLFCFPNYYFGMPALLKKFFERCLVLSSGEMVKMSDGSVTHRRRFSYKNRCVVICTCGFCHIKKNTEPIREHLQLLYPGNCQKLFIPESEIFLNPFLLNLTRPVFEKMMDAGSQYAKEGKISLKTRRFIQTPILDEAAFLNMANARWRAICGGNGSVRLSLSERFHSVMECIMAVIDMQLLTVQRAVLELQLHQTSLKLQLLLDKESGKRILSENTGVFLAYDVRIITNLDFFLTRKKENWQKDDSNNVIDIASLMKMLNEAVKTKLPIALQML